MEDFIKREEFNDLKEKVNKLEEEITNSNKLLSKIDGKLDVIGEKLKNTDTVNELKNKNIIGQVEHNTAEIENLRGNQAKFVWLIIGEVIGLIFLAIKSFI